ncbi:MAG: nickel-dependent hydrogenase large subunit [Proteobacteria bacterium]|nr:nickel-dependent hydrogenase large subunit [Pseudomonadota bacterium]
MTDEGRLETFVRGCEAVPGHRPWPRVRAGRAQWRALADLLAKTEWELLALWAEPAEVHVALRDETTLAVVSHPCPEGRFPSLGRIRPGAIRMERAVHDLFGLLAEGRADDRPWLDHGRWPVTAPLGKERAPRLGPPREAADYGFLPVEGEGLHEIPVGPVHAGIIEPGHFRFHANGETVARLEERLGYVHKGIESLMQGRTADEAARLAARVSGDSTVAHSLAFARAVEAAAETTAPPRADALRAVMAELERIANHLGDFGAICNDASFGFIHAHAMALRELVLRAAGACFGHRLMMDRVVPGGVACDLSAKGAATLKRLIAEMRPRFEALVEVYDNKPSLLDRTVTTGVTLTHLVHRFAAGGYVGRAAGRGMDARKVPGYPPYERLDFEVPVLIEGDVNARVWIRFTEIGESLRLLAQLLDHLPSGEVRRSVPGRAGEGLAIVEGFRGDVLTWVALDGEGRVRRCHPRDPSWLQWPLLEAAILGNIVADFPLCNKSFNCSYSGHDL